MNLSFYQLFIGLSVSLSPFVLAEDRWWDVIPANEKSPFRGGNRNDTDKLSPEVVAVLQQEKFKEWVKYEDEFVSFEYPKNELIKFEVKKPQQGIKVEGGVCTSVDNSFTQAYILKVGELTYGVMLLNPAQWLDDGICLCGPMVHHAYQIKNSTVKRFSMLPSGAVKKAQVVGGGLRFMAFEWTHLACPRTVYERMVNSMRLKTKEKGGDVTLKKKLITMYGADGKIGMTAKGTSVSELVKKFGEPLTKSKDNLWTWKWVGEDYPMTLNATVIDGKLVNLPDSGILRDRKNPVYGSKAWCEWVIENLSNIETRNYSLSEGSVSVGELQEKEKFVFEDKDKKVLSRKITELLRLNIGKTEGQYGGKWFDATYLAKVAAENGMSDEKWTELIRQHAVGNWAEIDYMKQVDDPDLGTWSLEILEKIQLGKIKGIRDESVIELAEILGEANPEGWKLLAPELWNSDNLQLKAAALVNSTMVDRKIIEPWILEVVEHENAISFKNLLCLAVKAINSQEWEESARLQKAIEQLPADGVNFEWEEIRESAIEALKK